MKTIQWSWAFTALTCGFLLTACGDGSTVGLSDGGRDGGGARPEDAAVRPDVGLGPEVDGGVGGDAGDDAATPLIDADDDGIPQALDCDDGDPAIGVAAETDCTNACGAGTRACADGVWTACTAPTDCLCAVAGETRIVSCGNCGEKVQACGDSGTWADTSDCLGEGECAPSTVETVENDYCEQQQRLCRTSCEWGDWTVTRPAGECRRGSSECPIFCSVSRGYSCDDMCRLGPPPDWCTVHCD